MFAFVIRDLKFTYLDDSIALSVLLTFHVYAGSLINLKAFKFYAS